MSSDVRFEPLTPERWRDLEQLFGPNGAFGGCWCMWWRQTRKQFDQQKGEQNRANLRALVDTGGVPGLLAYSGAEPVGWVSFGPPGGFPIAPAFARLEAG